MTTRPSGVDQVLFIKDHIRNLTKMVHAYHLSNDIAYSFSLARFMAGYSGKSANFGVLLMSFLNRIFSGRLSKPKETPQKTEPTIVMPDAPTPRSCSRSKTALLGENKMSPTFHSSKSRWAMSSKVARSQPMDSVGDTSRYNHLNQIL